MLAVAVALLVVGWRRDRPVAGILVVALAAVMAATIASSLVLVDDFSVVSKTNRYLWVPIGLFLWVAVGHAVARLLVAPSIQSGDRRRMKLVATAPWVLATVVVVALASIAVSGSGPKHEAGSASYGALRKHSQVLAGLHAPNGFVVMIDTDPLPSALMLQGLIGQLTYSEVHVGIPKNLDTFGIFNSYQRRHPPTGSEDAVILIRSGAAADDPPPGFCEISRYDPADPWPRFEGYDGTILFAGGVQSAVFLGEVPGEVQTVGDTSSTRVVQELCEHAQAS